MAARKVLLISADQWRGDALGSLGHPAARTPNLDQLAADAVRFDQHYTNAVPCGPARATLLTGLYPHIHRSVRNGTPLDARHSNIALEVRKAGIDPVLFGYTDSSMDPRACPPGDPRLKTFEGYLPGFNVQAALNEGCLEEWLTELAGRGYDIPEKHYDIYSHVGTPAAMDHFSRAPARYKAEDSDTAFIADRVLDYMQLRRDRDWFIHAVFLRPHPPIIAPAPYNEMIDVGDVPSPRRLETRERQASQHPFLATWLVEQDKPGAFTSQVNMHALTEADRDAARAVYFGLIAEVDHHIGRIIEHLKATGEYDQTLIIFTSDHGEMLGDHWLWGKGGWYDAANHIPLIVRDPRGSAASRGHSVSQFTESVDLVPTMLGWLGLDVPAECNGLDLADWAAGRTPDRWRRHAFWEFDFRDPITRYYEQALGVSSDECTLNVLRDAHYKYVHFTSLPPLLYDLQADPDERFNLADDPAHATTVAKYARALASHRMLHAERSLANQMLSASGVVAGSERRGTPDTLFETIGG